MAEWFSFVSRLAPDRQSRIIAIRKAAPVALVLGAVFLITIRDIVLDQDHHWPISSYPMYSGKSKPPTLLFGVVGGQEVRITSVSPFDHSRLISALSHNMRPGERHAVLKWVLARQPSKVRAIHLRNIDGAVTHGIVR